MNKTIKALSLVASLALMGAAPVLADTAAPTVKVDGLVDAYYTYNFTNSANKVQGAGNSSAYWYNTTDNSYSLGLAEAKITATQGAATGVVELAYQDVAGLTPLVDSTGTGIAGVGVLQAYASYNTGAWTITGGRFVTWIGNEVVEASSNWNYSHSLLFWYTIPVWNQGISVGLAVDPTLSITGYATNGWNAATNTASFTAQTFGAQLAWTPSSMWKVVLNGIDGPGNYNGFDRWVGEAIIDYNPTSDWSFALDATYGGQDLGSSIATNLNGSSTNLTSDDIWGVDLYGKYAISSDWTAALRLEEVKDDANAYGLYQSATNFGAATAKTGEGREATLTLTHAFTPAWSCSLEGRYDYVVVNGKVPAGTAGDPGPFAANSADQLTATLSTAFVF
ncbi:MAG TPA: outer membrane beta-barrel protein [bacterium]|nr:outer membrane beta-barrel protein [bacterium]